MDVKDITGALIVVGLVVVGVLIASWAEKNISALSSS